MFRRFTEGIKFELETLQIKAQISPDVRVFGVISFVRIKYFILFVFFVERDRLFLPSRLALMGGHGGTHC